jgi:hypothetical protein
MRMLRTGIVLAVLLATAALCTSCNTPTLPIPPPIVDSAHLAITESDPGPPRIVELVLQPGACIERTQYLMVLNVDQQIGAFAARRPDMTFVVDIQANSGENLLLMCMVSLFDVGQSAQVVAP